MQNRVLAVQICLFLLCLLLPQLTHAASDSRRIIPTGARGQGQGERRVALIIGNAAYQDASARLQNPVNDARSMEAVLQKSGFDVITRTNTDRRTLYAAVKEFGQKLKKSDVGLFYYAGHGVQIDSANYLLPVDLKLGDLNDGDDLRRDAYPLAELLDRMREANTRNIVIFDACRDNPFSAKGGRSSSRGLAKIATPPETAILYATDFGNTAGDGAGSDNGIFTRNLVQAIGKGLELVELMRQVQGGVRKETGGKQKPIFDGLLSVSFYFNAPVTVPAAPAVSHAADAEKAAWQAIESSADPSDFRDFLKEYPSGSYAGAARLKLKQLEKKQTATAAASHAEQQRISREQAEATRRAQAAEERAAAAERRAAEERSRAEAAERARAEVASRPAAVTPVASSSRGFTDPVTGMQFVPVKEGCFEMGCGGWFSGCEDDEKPVHEVCVGSFMMGTYEVTQGQWKKVMGSNPSQFKSCGDNCPVEQVSWNDAQEFIKKLNQQSGKAYRLPTEAEWEYAARSGGKKEKYAGGDDIDAVAWYESNSDSKTHPVGQKQKNGLGLYDMSGNVWEWCSDWYGKESYGDSPRDNPQGPSSGSYRVDRGGSWFYDPSSVRASYRNNHSPDNRYGNLGFRLSAPVQ